MNEGLYHAVGAMRAAERRVEITSNNLANLSTHGYKRKLASQQEFRVLTDQGEGRGLGTRGLTDFSQGPVDRTGYPLHLALRGPGFFAVDSPTGEVYTRNGQFEANQDGEFVTPEGLPVVWEERLGAYQSNGPDPVVEGNGEVHQGAIRLGRLRVVDFEDYQGLEELDSGFYRAGEATVQTNPLGEIAQGELEMSNGTGINEMVDLISNQRGYEMAARALQTINESFERLNRPS